MPGQSDDRRGKVPLKAFLVDFRSVMSDQELKRKYQLTAQAYVSLIKALMAQNVVTPADLDRRRQMAVQRDLAKESEFLAGLFICPNCGHPHPVPFSTCPACGANPDDFLPGKEFLDSLTTTGGHLYVDQPPKERAPEIPEESEQLVEVDEPEEEVVVEEWEPITEETETQKPKKSSALGAVRSFLSKRLTKE
jgi:hypothetical protein